MNISFSVSLRPHLRCMNFEFARREFENLSWCMWLSSRLILTSFLSVWFQCKICSTSVVVSLLTEPPHSWFHWNCDIKSSSFSSVSNSLRTSMQSSAYQMVPQSILQTLSNITIFRQLRWMLRWTPLHAGRACSAVTGGLAVERFLLSSTKALHSNSAVFS